MMRFTARLKRNDLHFFERQFFSFLLAFVGVVYELSFAQILSATLGNTSLRYATTIGLFTLTLGLASLAYDKYKFQLPVLQLALFASGVLGPFLIIAADPKNFPPEWALVAEVFSYLPIVAVGLISGFELPLLLDQCESRLKSFILAADYFGMFLGTLVFPLLLLPWLGVQRSLYFCAFLNVLTFIYLLIKPRRTA